MASTERHDPQIDGLRAIAVIAVLYSHYWNPDSDAGSLGVRLFFVISGFLISRILLAQRFAAEDVDRGRVARAFYARRALRIFPAYYLVLFVAVAAGVEGMADTWPWHAFYASNLLFTWTGAWDPWPAAPFWTLAVEEQFYLVWPAFMLWLPRRRLAPFLICAILGSLVFKEVWGRFHPFSLGHYILMPAAIDALAAGAILSSLGLLFGVQAGAEQRLSRWLAVASVVALVLVLTGVVEAVPAVVPTDVSLLLPLCWIVFAASRGLPGLAGRVLGNPALRYLGRISYGIYLWHFIVLALLLQYVPAFGQISPAPGAVRFLCVGALDIGVAALSWHLLEKPINRWKRNAPYRARSPAS